MILLKLIGAAVLLGAALAAALGYRRALVSKRETLQSWIAFLQRLQHGIRTSAQPVAQAVAAVDSTQRRQLLGGKESTEPLPYRALLRRGGEVLGGSCGEALLRLAEHTEQATDGIHAAEEIDGVLMLLEQERAALQREEEPRTRVVTALCTCGALGLILLLW